MTSDKQTAANRRNALKSTGPRTLRGKSFSRVNARRHGAWCGLTALTPDDLAAVHLIRQRVVEEFIANTPADDDLLIDLSFAIWRYRRALALEDHALTAPDLPDSARVEMMNESCRARGIHNRVLANAIQRMCKHTHLPNFSRISPLWWHAEDSVSQNAN